MSKPNPIPPCHDPLKLRGEEDWEVRLGADVRVSTDEPVPQVTGHTVWYVRWGQAASTFFTRLSEQFSRLWQGVRSAGEAVARFISGRGAQPDATIATRHIKAPVSETAAPQATVAPLAADQANRVPGDEEAQPACPPPAKGALGAIPSSLPGTEKTAQQLPSDTQQSIGRATFEAYRHKHGQGQDILEFFANDDCVSFANNILKNAARIERHGQSLDAGQEALRSDARQFLSLRDIHRLLQRSKQEKEARQAERLAQAEALATKEPGQHDFEGFVASYASHRDQNLRFTIHDNSKYLDEQCLAYGRARGAQRSPDEQAALEYLERWRSSPGSARRQTEAASGFVHLASPGLPAPAGDVTSPQAASSQVAVPVPDQTPAAPPPPPAPRWISLLNQMPSWPKVQLIQVAPMLDMNDDDLAGAIEGLRALAREAAGSNVRPSSGSGNATSVEQKMNQQAEAQRRHDELLKSFELARLLAGRLSTLGKPPWAQPELALLAKLATVTADLDRALEKRIGELLPAKKASASVAEKRIPSLMELTEEQAFDGSALFEKYVGAYDKLSNSPTYALPDGSAYLSPACLAYARAFYGVVERMPVGAEVDTARLGAAIYLLAEARKRGYADTPG